MSVETPLTPPLNQQRFGEGLSEERLPEGVGLRPHVII